MKEIVREKERRQTGDSLGEYLITELTHCILFIPVSQKSNVEVVHTLARSTPTLLSIMNNIAKFIAFFAF